LAAEPGAQQQTITTDEEEKDGLHAIGRLSSGAATIRAE
jgi:hypothetical protein